MNIDFWFGVIFFTFFWIFLTFRIVAMHRAGIKTLTLSTKSNIKNVLSIFGFFGILLIWSIIFIINTIFVIDSILFSFFWDPKGVLLIKYFSYLLAVIFQGFMWLAIHTMGKSWRIGIDNENPNDLVTHGIFKISRNPIFLGLDGIVVCVFIILPNLFFLGFAIITVIMIHIQILKEEKHLQKIYEEAYKLYCSKTKRYFLFF